MNKTVWITGGSRGIGAACVHAFTEAGWKVAFCYHSRTEDAERVAAQTGALAIRCDLTKREQVNACAAQIRKTLGAIGAVVCNAGVAQQKMFCDLTDATGILSWTTICAVYFIPYRRHCQPYPREGGRNRYSFMGMGTDRRIV